MKKRFKKINPKGEVMAKLSPVKEKMVKIIKEQPEDSTFDDILRELAFARMIEKGLIDSDEKHVISHDELKRRIRNWQK